MSDQDVAANVRLTATDDSAAVFAAFAQRIKDASTAAQKSFGDGINKTLTDASKQLDELGRKAKSSIGGDMTGALNQANLAAGILMGNFSFLGIGAIEEFTRRSIINFAAVERGMEMIGFATEATQAQLADIGRTISEVARETGQSIAQTQGQFEQFAASAGLAPEEASKQFKLLSDAAVATGSSIEDMSRISTAALNTMKVPPEEMNKMFDQLAVAVPGKLISAFASMVPRLTQSLSQVGLEGGRNLAQLGVIFSQIETAAGGPLLAARQLNDIILKMNDPFSTLGAAMYQSMEQARKSGAGLNEEMAKLAEFAKQHGAFGDVRSRATFAQNFGLDANGIRALEAYSSSLDKINAALARGDNVGATVLQRRMQLEKDEQFAVNSLVSAFEDLENAFASLMEAMGSNTVLQGVAEVIKDLATDAKAVAWILNGAPGFLDGSGSKTGAARTPTAPGTPPAPKTAWQKFTGYASGTSYVPHDMVAEIHEGEKIIPAGEARDQDRAATEATAQNTDAIQRLTELLTEDREDRRNIRYSIGNRGGLAFTPGPNSFATAEAMVPGAVTGGGPGGADAAGGMNVPGVGWVPGAAPGGGHGGSTGGGGASAGSWSTGAAPETPMEAGDSVGTGQGHGGRFNVPAGTPLIPSSQQETVTLSNGQKFTVSKRTAAQFRGFFNDLIAAGAPVHSLGGLGTRGNPSQHPIGYAVDWAQSGRNRVSPDVLRWMQQNPEVLNALEARWGMSGAEHWRSPDTGHFSIDTLFGSEHLAQAMAGQGGGADAPGGFTGTGSTYNPLAPGGYDSGGPSTATGEPYNPGDFSGAINQSLRGAFGGVSGKSGPGWALVEDPSGKAAIVRINDVMGASMNNSGRVIDLNANTEKFFGSKGLHPGMRVTPLKGYKGQGGPITPAQAAALRGGGASFDQRFGSFSKNGQQNVGNNEWGQPDENPNSFNQRFGSFSPSGDQDVAKRQWGALREHLEKPIQLKVSGPSLSAWKRGILNRGAGRRMVEQQMTDNRDSLALDYGMH